MWRRKKLIPFCRGLGKAGASKTGVFVQDPRGQPVARSRVDNKSRGREATLRVWTEGRESPAGHPARDRGDGTKRQRLRAVGQLDQPEGQGSNQDRIPGRGVQRTLDAGGHGPGPERRRCGASGADDRREVGQPHHAGQVHRGPGCR